MSLKSAFSLFSFPQGTDLTWAFDHIAAAGYDGAELVMGSRGGLTPETSERELDVIAREARSRNLEIHSVGVWSIWENNLLSDERRIRERAHAILERQLEAAAILGADKTLMVPGFVGCDFIPGGGRVGYEAAYDRCRESFSRLGIRARALNVKIGIENVWNKFLLSPLEMRALIDEIANPYVGVYFDTGNVLYTGYPDDWIRILGERIIGIHLSDYRCSQAGLGAFVDLFAGNVDFRAVAEALGEISYNGYLTLEMLPNYEEFPELSCRSNKPGVDKILAMVQGTGV